MFQETFQYLLNEFNNIFVKKTLNGTVVANDGDYEHLLNKPKLFSGNFHDLTNIPDFYSSFDGTYNSLKDKPSIISTDEFNRHVEQTEKIMKQIENKIEQPKYKQINLTHYYEDIIPTLLQQGYYVKDIPFAGTTIQQLTEKDGLIGEILCHCNNITFQLIFDKGYLAPILYNIPLSDLKINLQSQLFSYDNDVLELKIYNFEGEIIKQENQNIFRTTISTKNIPLHIK